MDHPSEVITARLLNDGPMKWPLWLGNGIADDRRRQPISLELATALLEWTRFYHDHYRDAWDVPESVLSYNEMGRVVAQRVSSELGPGFQVLLLLEESEGESEQWVEVSPPT